MPTYEYQCLSCETNFDAQASVALRDADRDCPQCGARRVRRLLNSSFYARASGGNGGSVALGGG
jgi:putative FmdB family regulatory protein